MSVVAGIVLIVSFPTSTDRVAFESWLLATSVASAIRKRRPDLADRVVLDEDLPSPAVRMNLRGGRCVLLARASERGVTSWDIGTPDCHVARVAEPGGHQAIASLMIAAYLRYAP